MKNKTQVGIGIGLMCVLLTTGIVVQLNTINEATKIADFLLDKDKVIIKTVDKENKEEITYSKDDPIFEQEELREEVLESKAEYERLYKELENKEKELEKARQESTKESSKAAELQAELDSKNKLLGLTEISRLWNNINT